MCGSQLLYKKIKIKEKPSKTTVEILLCSLFPYSTIYILKKEKKKIMAKSKMNVLHAKQWFKSDTMILVI
jgi:hypothetical protein